MYTPLVSKHEVWHRFGDISPATVFPAAVFISAVSALLLIISISTSGWWSVSVFPSGNPTTIKYNAGLSRVCCTSVCSHTCISCTSSLHINACPVHYLHLRIHRITSHTHAHTRAHTPHSVLLLSSHAVLVFDETSLMKSLILLNSCWCREHYQLQLRWLPVHKHRLHSHPRVPRTVQHQHNPINHCLRHVCSHRASEPARLS